MTDHEDISRRLALAIGWHEDDVWSTTTSDYAFVLAGNGTVRFDYQCPLVIWPIAERFNCFPKKVGSEWHVVFLETAQPRNLYCSLYADTAALAVALAVIKAKKSK